MAGTAGFQTEHSMGDVLVPADALWGAQAQFLQAQALLPYPAWPGRADPPVPVLPGLADGSGPLA